MRVIRLQGVEVQAKPAAPAGKQFSYMRPFVPQLCVCLRVHEHKKQNGQRLACTIVTCTATTSNSVRAVRTLMMMQSSSASKDSFFKCGQSWLYHLQNSNITTQTERRPGPMD